MSPRFSETWDRFNSIEDYELHAGRWLDEIMRILNKEGSAFFLGTFHNIGLINRLCQIRKIFIINEISWLIRNGRPPVSRTHLHHSHNNILWIAKEIGHYRFNYQLCKRTHYLNDHLSSRNVCMRDVWYIPTAPHENKNYRHPSPKPLALYRRMLDVAGKPGGLLVEPFAGSGPGAVAALQWGMESISIEREAKYADMIRRRVADEVRRRPTDL